MQRLSRLTSIFAILFTVFIVTPAFLGDPFAPYPLIKNGDVLDILTPLVLIPLYWLLFKIHPRYPPSPQETLVFLLFAVLWVQGQGMHLVANSIGHLASGAGDAGSDLERLIHFYDETLSHYIWHFGLLGLSALLIYRQWRNPLVKGRSRLRWEITAGVIYGLTYFIDVIESATTILGVPFAMGVVLFVSIWGRKYLCQQPILIFFLTSHAIACLLFLGWGLYWGGFPEFSQIGIID